MRKPTEPRSRDGGVDFRLSRFSTAYRNRLIDGLRDVCNYLKWNSLGKLSHIVRNPQTTDHCLAAYVIDRHGEKHKKQLTLVKHGLLCCQHVYPRLRGQLQTAWGNLKTWEEERVSRLRPPLPVPIWLNAVGLARAHARMESQEKIRQQWVLFSALIELGFFCLLRPGEIFRLKHCDVAMPSGLTLCEQHAAIKIVSPKNRRQFGESQFVLLCNRNTIGWLKTIHIPHSEQLIWDRSPRVFALLMKQVMRELGVANCKFTPASLRPGGATMYYSRGISISTLRFMGRWSVERSLEHYIQQAMAAQIMNALSTKAVNRLKLLSPHCLAQILLDHLEKTDPELQVLSPPENGEGVLEWCRKYIQLDLICRP